MNEHSLMFLYLLDQHLERVYVKAKELLPLGVMGRLQKFTDVKQKSTTTWAEFAARHARVKG
jgi:hypothetical protein